MKLGEKDTDSAGENSLGSERDPSTKFFLPLFAPRRKKEGKETEVTPCTYLNRNVPIVCLDRRIEG